MQPHIARSLENNDPPSEAVLSEIKRLLSQPLQDLEEKDAQIEHLLRTLKDLQDERDVIHKSIEQYSPILTPVRRLPSDILDEIFYHCLPTDRNPNMTINEAPLLLTRICHLWRSIALSSPRLWAQLHIPLAPYPIRSSSPYPTSAYTTCTLGCCPQAPGIHKSGTRDKHRHKLVEKHAKAMEECRKLARIWLSRSGNYPLSISLKYLGINLPPGAYLGDENPFIQLFNTVLSCSERFDDLQLEMPFEILQIVQARISVDLLPGLKKLRIHFNGSTPFMSWGGPYQSPYGPKRSVGLLEAPNLHSLSLFSGQTAAFDSSSIPSGWENLTHLSFHSAITSAEAVKVLQRCQNLDHCKLVISDGEDVYIAPDNVLSLLRLRFLCIRLEVGSTDKMALLYRRIDAPMLEWFDYGYRNSSTDTTYDNDVPISPPFTPSSPTMSTTSPILSLVEKSSRIKKLSLDSYILGHTDILFALRFASQLTHLMLAHRRQPNGSLHTGIGYSGFPMTNEPGYFDLDLLIIEEDSESEILLPQLEVFEATPATFTDDSLQRFIVGRLGDPAGKGVVSLRSVKVTFEGPMEMDISEEIYRRAEEVGAKIALDLVYLAGTSTTT